MEIGLVAAYKKEFGKGKQEFNCVEAEIDRETGEIYVYKVVEIVDEVLDPLNEISLDDATQMGYEDVEIGDEIELAVDVEDLGYLAAGAAKNAIASKVKESEGAPTTSPLWSTSAEQKPSCPRKSRQETRDMTEEQR